MPCLKLGGGLDNITRLTVDFPTQGVFIHLHEIGSYLQICSSYLTVLGDELTYYCQSDLLWSYLIKGATQLIMGCFIGTVIFNCIFKSCLLTTLRVDDLLRSQYILHTWVLILSRFYLHVRYCLSACSEVYLSTWYNPLAGSMLLTCIGLCPRGSNAMSICTDLL